MKKPITIILITLVYFALISENVAVPNASGPRTKEVGSGSAPHVLLTGHDKYDRAALTFRRAWGVGESTSAVHDIVFCTQVTKEFDTEQKWEGATDGDTPMEFFAAGDYGNLYRINPRMQTITLVGECGAGIRELAYNEHTHVLYGTDYSWLYSVDRITGQAAAIGNMGGPGAFQAMDYHAGLDKLLTISCMDKCLYEVDPATAQITLIDTLDYDGRFISDIWYDELTDWLIAVAQYHENIGDNKWRYLYDIHYIIEMILPDSAYVSELGRGYPGCILGLGDTRGSLLWRVRDIDLFQDNFPADGSLLGAAAVDAAIDITPLGDGQVIPGDSAVISVCDTTGIEYHDPMDPLSGPAVYCYVTCLNGDAPDHFAPDMQERDPPNEYPPAAPNSLRWPLVESTLGSSTLWGTETENPRALMWHRFRMDSCYLYSGRYYEVANSYCMDLNDNLFTPPDTVLFFFSARNTHGNMNYYSEFTGPTDNPIEVQNYPMELQMLPTGSTDILYVDNYNAGDAQHYFDTAFNGLSIFPDRYDIRGHSSIEGGGPGARVVSVADQLIPAYRKIIWNSGDLDSGTVGDGTGNPCDGNDWNMLWEFADQHDNPQGCGIYLSGNSLAEEWATLTGECADTFKTTYMSFKLMSGDQQTMMHGEHPLVIGTPATSQVRFYQGTGPDTLIAYNGGFDVLEAINTSSCEMGYDSTDVPIDQAVVAKDTLNPQGKDVRVVLSGFSYHCIRDDRHGSIPDRMHHLCSILQWFKNPVDDPVDIARMNLLRNSLDQNYPNPFNPSTTIRYSIRETAQVTLKIYDVEGRLVKTLVHQKQNPRDGGYTVEWNGRNNADSPVSSGVYFYRLVSKNSALTKKMVIIR